MPICILIWFQARALDPTNHIGQYGHTAWTRQSGQIPGAVFALTQTSDGNLWIGAEFGLRRFDGVRFLEWQPPSGQQLPDSYITALAAGRDGSLWIGTRKGLAHWKGNRFEIYPTSNGNAGPGVASILEDHEGTVWVGTVGYKSGGLCRVEGNRLECRSADPHGPAGPGVLSLFESPARELWMGIMGGVTRWKPEFLHLDAGPNSMVESVSGDALGHVWVTVNNGLSSLSRNRLDPVREVDRGVHPNYLLDDRDGGLWVGTRGQGLLHLYHGAVDRFTRADGLSHDDIRCFFEDREGNIWVGTAGGLDRFRDLPVTTLSKNEGLAQDFVTSLASGRAGGMWIGTAKGLNYLEHGVMRRFDTRDGLPWNAITAIFEDREGRLWVDSDRGLALLEGRRFQVPCPLASKMRLITAYAEDRDGAVWFSDRGIGLIRYSKNREVQVVPWSVFGGQQAWTMTPDLAGGGLWLGFTGGALAYYKLSQAPQWYGPRNGLPGGLISDLHMGKDQTLWIATERGLGRLRDGKITTMDVRNGLPCNRIHAIVEDDNGALWLNMACGLARVQAAGLREWGSNPRSRVAVKTYDNQDGMPTHATPTGYFRRAARSNDGKLWFAAVSELAVVDPNHLRENRLAPPVEIEQITADHRNYVFNSPVTLPHHTRDLEIDYAALSFVAPEKVRYRYRLEGFDGDWKDAGVRRQALYTNLPPRSYRFQVIAANDDGVWNYRGASLAFSIEPAVYQTTWFQALAGIGMLGLVWQFYRFRVRQLEFQLNLKYEGRLAERARIARELHDTLVQNISGFSLQIGAIAKLVESSGAKNLLDGLRVELEHWLREVRESVWDLRSPEAAEVDLQTALEKAGERVVVGEHVKLGISVAGRHLPTSAYLKEQLVRIVQEAVRNAVRHGHATHVTVRAVYQRRKWIRLLIRDDGCGFDPARASKIGHCGLSTMHERALQIGGELKIHSAPGQGTEVELVAPLAPGRGEQAGV